MIGTAGQLALFVVYIQLFFMASVSGQTSGNFPVSLTSYWTWISGSKYNQTAPIFGPRGVYNASYKPGSTERGAAWVVNGDLYIMLGLLTPVTSSTVFFSNALWRLRSSDSSWGWIAGYSTSVAEYSSFPSSYGIKGVPALGNTPSARIHSTTSVYKDALLLFGGCKLTSGSMSSASSFANDLWKFNTSEGLWSWVSGSSTKNAIGIYNGSVSNPYVPGSRCQMNGFLRIQSASFFVFGGYGYDGAGDTNTLNDVWQFDLVNQSWSWVGGNSLGGGKGIYPSKVGYTGGRPATRRGFPAWYDSDTDLFFLFGGYDS
jgi:hypothetical protein